MGDKTAIPTPPSWMRHLTPWGLLEWIDYRLNTCWANMVMWKLGYGGAWALDCELDGPEGEEPCCYCGKYMSRSEFEEAKSHWRKPPIISASQQAPR